jgi:TPR repeat protein
MPVSGQRAWRFSVLLLGVASIVGIGCATISLPPDAQDAAEKQYLPAAERGDLLSQYRLSMAYRFGTAGVPQNDALALRWLKSAAGGGLADAQMALGDVFAYGQLGQPKQADEALLWWRKAAEQGGTDAQVYLAGQLEDGRLIAADLSEAARLYERAGRAGHRYARLKLARLLEASAPEKALGWFVAAGAAADSERLRRRLSPEQLRRAEIFSATLRGELK